MISVVLLVVTLSVPGFPGTRAVAADWPFFRNFSECQQAVVGMRRLPLVVETVKCEPHVLNLATGRIM